MALQAVPGQRGNPLCPVDLKPEPASESPGGLLKEHWVHPQVSCSAGLGWSPGICNSSKFPVDADAAGPGTTPQPQLLWTFCPQSCHWSHTRHRICDSDAQFRSIYRDDTPLKESTGVTLFLHLNLRALSHLETAQALRGRQVQAILRISTRSCHLNGLLPSGVPKLSTRPFLPASLLSFPSSLPPWQVFFYVDILWKKKKNAANLLSGNVGTKPII